MNSVERAFIARSQFILKQKVQWFPGHMRKGIDVELYMKLMIVFVDLFDLLVLYYFRNQRHWSNFEKYRFDS